MNFLGLLSIFWNSYNILDFPFYAFDVDFICADSLSLRQEKLHELCIYS